MYAYFAGGCFWCITPIFKNIKGVRNVISGYCGGKEINPTYEQVKSQNTGHRETIAIEYDENIIDYKDLLEVFLNNVDLYDEGGQYIDRGHSYTLAIYYVDNNQKQITENKLSTYSKKVYVSIEPFTNFYPAEEYHQDYYLKNPEAFEEELIQSGRIKIELNENELSNVSAGKNVITIMEELLPLASKYPEIIEMMDAFENGDYEKLIKMLQKFKIEHPDLVYIFED